MAEAPPIRVTVLYSPRAREVHEWQLTLSCGATLLQALRASGVDELLTDAKLVDLSVGIWGRQARLNQVLRAGDRLEIYRPLRIDPKLARRERFRKQGVRAAGLFARGKSGKACGD